MSKQELQGASVPDGYKPITPREWLDYPLQQRYPTLGTYAESRDASGKLRATMHAWTNATHRMEVRNAFDGRLYYREVLLESEQQPGQAE